MITDGDPKPIKRALMETIGGDLEKRKESFESDYEQIKDVPKQLTKEEKERIKEILRHNENELNDLSYREALKYDNRNFWKFYYALLKNKHQFLTLIENRDYNAKGIKLFLCFFSFAFGYATNALFFDDDTMHKINEDGGDFNFWYQLPQIMYSTIISYFLENFLNFLALSEEDIVSIKQEKVIKNVGRKAKEVARTLSIKFFFFYVLSFILLIIFWYYVGCFGVVYKNTQIHLMKDTLIGFGTSSLYPFAMYILPPIFRVPSLKSYSKTKEAMYKFSQALLFF